MNAFLIQSRFDCRLMLVVFATLLPGSIALAGQPYRLPPDACQLRSALDQEELCGWVYPATHDSVAYHSTRVRVNVQDMNVSTSSESESSAGELSQNSMFRGATVVLASLGIPVESLLEPTALVTPYVDRSAARLRTLRESWAQVMARAERVQEQSETTALQAILEAEQLARIAEEEPVDAESVTTPSVTTQSVPTQSIADGEPGIEIKPLTRRVGSSVMIATLEEAYMPYDMAEADLRLWHVLPRSTQPVCIRGDEEGWDTAAMWQAFDARVTRNVPFMDPVASDESPKLASTANEVDESMVWMEWSDCLLESWVWTAETWVADHAEVLDAVNANEMGRRVAEWSIGQDAWIQKATKRAIRHWTYEEHPEPIIIDYPVNASMSGAALLARAGAVVAAEPVIEIAVESRTVR